MYETLLYFFLILRVRGGDTEKNPKNFGVIGWFSYEFSRHFKKNELIFALL
jgi:hypothetical protein